MPVPSPLGQGLPWMEWGDDADLMHHYHISTSFTLPGSADLRHIHQVQFKQLALAQQALKHQLLALTSFHLAYLHPSHKQVHTTRGLKHQTAATHGIGSQLMSITPKTSHAFFVASLLLVFSSFASLAANQDAGSASQPRLKDLLGIFHTIRGMYAVLDSFKYDLAQGCLADMFRQRHHDRQESRLESLLLSLQEMLQKLQPSIQSPPPQNDAIKRAIFTLIVCIEDAIDSAPPPYEWRVVMQWPISLTQEFLLLVEDRDELALGVLAKYCTILQNVPPIAWYANGWGRSILQEVEKGKAESVVEESV